MKIRQVLKEAAGVTAAFAFGRFNPAHQGHIAVWQTVEKAGVKWYIGTNPGTIGPNDPLTFEQKSAWMTEIYPQIAGHIVPETSVMTLAARIFKELGGNEDSTIAYITDADDWAWSGKLLNQYNGVEGKHGYYKFAQIIHVPSPRVSSATALRDAARADDKVAFYHASGTDPKLKVAGKTYFDTVKEAVTKYPLPVKKAKKTEGVEEGLGKDLKRLATGKDVKSRAGQEIAKSQDASMKGDNKTANKHFKRYDKLDKLANKEQGVAEAHPNSKIYDKCWDGHKKVPGKKRGEPGSCAKESFTPMEIAVMEGGHSLDEASLATMRDYFAGDENAKDPTKLSQMRDFFNKHKPEGRVVDKNFNSKSSYEHWLKQNKFKKVSEDATDLSVGDPVVITGNVEFNGTTGEIVGFGQNNAFVIVDLYNHGKHSFHSSDVSYNDYADSDAEEARMYDAGEFRDMEESDDKIAGRYDPDEFDSMVSRLSKIAKAGPMKTVWDPEKRVYKNVPDTDKQKKIAEAVVKVVEVIKQRKGLWKNK